MEWCFQSNTPGTNLQFISAVHWRTKTASAIQLGIRQHGCCNHCAVQHSRYKEQSEVDVTAVLLRCTNTVSQSGTASPVLPKAVKHATASKTNANTVSQPPENRQRTVRGCSTHPRPAEAVVHTSHASRPADSRQFDCCPAVSMAQPPHNALDCQV